VAVKTAGREAASGRLSDLIDNRLLITAGLAIGGMVTLGALLGGPVSGASMNPVRSLAPAVVSGRLDHLWIYLTAPFVGAAVAVVACRCSRPAGCCDGRCSPESPA
jgi:aquaporin Z